MELEYIGNWPIAFRKWTFSSVNTVITWRFFCGFHHPISKRNKTKTKKMDSSITAFFWNELFIISNYRDDLEKHDISAIRRRYWWVGGFIPRFRGLKTKKMDLWRSGKASLSCYPENMPILSEFMFNQE